MSIILKDTGRDDNRLFAVHVICDDYSILPSKENQISFWVNCDHYVVVIKFWATKSNICPSTQHPHADPMLQSPIISTIVFKDLD
jgi:hypothetical protein